MITSDVRDLLGVEHAVVQAGLGGGLSRAELAAAVSLAGGLGTIGISVDPEQYRADIRHTRERAEGMRFAANLLFPVMRRAHVRACIEERVPVVSLFFGFDRKLVEALHEAGSVVLHQVGTVDQAVRAMADGADVVVVQGASAGGHLLATQPLHSILPKVLEFSEGRPVLAAGGIHDRETARAALDAGASGVSVGTRFLLTKESHAHDVYKSRLLGARSTLVTLLFGMGWSARHRVVPNAATARWCARDPLGPGWMRAVNSATGALARRMPPGSAASLILRQRVAFPFYTPAALTRDMPEALVDVTPLYAGECVSAIDSIVSAEDVVREIAGN